MSDVKNKWENSSWGRKLIVQKKRASLNDFDRFKIMLAKIKVCSSPFISFPQVSYIYWLFCLMGCFFCSILWWPIWSSVLCFYVAVKCWQPSSLLIKRMLMFCRGVEWSGRSLQSWKKRLHKILFLHGNLNFCDEFYARVVTWRFFCLFLLTLEIQCGLRETVLCF